MDISQFSWPHWLIVGVAGLGLTSSVLNAVKAVWKIACLKLYISRFRAFANASREQREEGSADWLVEHSAVLQSDMGRWGLAVGHFLGIGHVQNYPILINTLTRLRSGWAEREEVVSCQDSLLRYKGALKNHFWFHCKSALNPVRWIWNGARLLLLTPIQLLKQLGVLLPNQAEKAAKSLVTRVGIACFTAFTGVSALVSLVSGWSAFAEWVKEMVQ